MIATPDIARTIEFWRSDRNLSALAVWQQPELQRRIGPPPWCHPVTWEHLSDAMMVAFESGGRRPPDPVQAIEFRRRVVMRAQAA